MTVGLRIVWRKHHMMGTPPLHEVLEVAACELGSTVGAEAKRNTDLPEVPAEDPDGVGGRSVAFTWDDDRPPGESVRDDEERLPRNMEVG